MPLRSDFNYLILKGKQKRDKKTNVPLWNNCYRMELWEEPVLLQSPPEGVAPYPQIPGRLGLVAVVPFQGGEDMTSLQLLEGGGLPRPSLSERQAK
jgi:hypothetical protein